MVGRRRPEGNSQDRHSSDVPTDRFGRKSESWTGQQGDDTDGSDSTSRNVLQSSGERVSKDGRDHQQQDQYQQSGVVPDFSQANDQVRRDRHQKRDAAQAEHQEPGVDIRDFEAVKKKVDLSRAKDGLQPYANRHTLIR